MKNKDNDKFNNGLSGLLIDEEEDRSIRARLWYIWRLLWRDKSGLIGLIIFLVIIFYAIFA